MKKDALPSETEWLVMDALWNAGGAPLTSQEIINRLDGGRKLSPKTVRVLINRLYAKGMVDYTVDKKDSRVYHYTACVTREECQQLKSKQFTESYFSGNSAGALAALIKSSALSDAQLKELKELLEERG